MPGTKTAMDIFMKKLGVMNHKDVTLMFKQLVQEKKRRKNKKKSSKK